jgi:hypothetical protein
MIDDTSETSSSDEKFDQSAFPPDTLFHERRKGPDRRRKGTVRADDASSVPPLRIAKEQRVKKERRRRIDPTTFEKQYTEDELEFMNAMQQFKVQSCKSFPTHGEVLRVAYSLGYRKLVAGEVDEENNDAEPEADGGLELAAESSRTPE